MAFFKVLEIPPALFCEAPTKSQGMNMLQLKMIFGENVFKLKFDLYFPLPKDYSN